jgi:hypothetical protein
VCCVLWQGGQLWLFLELSLASPPPPTTLCLFVQAMQSAQQTTGVVAVWPQATAPLDISVYVLRVCHTVLP